MRQEYRRDSSGQVAKRINVATDNQTLFSSLLEGVWVILSHTN